MTKAHPEFRKNEKKKSETMAKQKKEKRLIIYYPTSESVIWNLQIQW